MIRHLKGIRKIAQRISDAENGALVAYRENRVVEEQQLTDRILGAIEDRFQNRSYSANGEDRLMDAPRVPVIVSHAAEDSIVTQPQGG